VRTAMPKAGEVLNDFLARIAAVRRRWATTQKPWNSFSCQLLMFVALLSLLAMWPLARDASWAVLTGSALLWVVLAAISVHDAHRLLIPDKLVFVLAVLGLAATLILQPNDLLARILAMLTAGASLWAFARFYAIVRGHEGLGFGDVKLAAASGSWIGVEGLSTMLAAACVTAVAAATVRRYKRGRVGATPFAPHLALGLWVTWCLGPLN
jgi:leader peptidase (prepilin peptidase) / N-methyltransferase